MTTHDEQWRAHYADLTDWLTEHDRMPRRVADARERRLATWLYAQRERSTKLPEWRAELLREVGVWETADDRSVSPEGLWGDTLQQVQAWIAQHHFAPVFRGESAPLSAWLDKQRRRAHDPLFVSFKALHVELLWQSGLLGERPGGYPGVVWVPRRWSSLPGRAADLALSGQAAWMVAGGAGLEEMRAVLRVRHERVHEVLERLGVDYRGKRRSKRHGSLTMWKDEKCPCDVCRAAAHEYHTERYRMRKNGEAWALGTGEMRAYLREHAGEIQRASQARAVQKYEPWTPDEVVVAADRSRSVRAAAETLGRTIRSVRHVREILADPTRGGHDRYVEMLKAGQKKRWIRAGTPKGR